MSEVYYFVSDLVEKAKFGWLEPEQITIPEPLKALLPPNADDPLAEA
jgi:hypothetical protein